MSADPAADSRQLTVAASSAGRYLTADGRII